MTTDQNLLLGVLALQLDYIDATQFVDACGAWSTRKDASLAEILRERGWIDELGQRTLERLVRRRVAIHDGSIPEALITALNDDVRGLLREVQDAEIEKTMSPLGPADPFVRVAVDIGFRGQERSHYTLSKKHGEGGLGRVWLARDRRLHRDVALKEMRPEVQSTQSMRRFLREARVTAQLDHPNIVPVYELIHEPTIGQPFYTMRFLRGRTLNQAIDHYHKLRREGRPANLELQDLLGAFIAVCQAIDYAHSKKVIHRDLKPANIMLGDFGEVIVLDWGLAKSLAAGPEASAEDQSGDDDDSADASEAQPGLSLSDGLVIDVTQTGQAVGTVAYMAPEQAAGDRPHIDHLTDVYGLGAILFRLLTGKRPHHGKGTREILAGILEGPSPVPRAVDPTIPPALNAICMKAMCKERGGRYQSVAALREDVRRWLADEAVMAYPEPWYEGYARWGRKHRPLMRTAIGALVVVALVILVAALGIDRARRAAQRSKVQAIENLRAAVATIDEMQTGVSEVLKDFPGTQRLRTLLLERAAQRYQQFADFQSDDPALQTEAARAMIRLGAVYLSLDRPGEAEAAYRRAIQSLESLLGKGPRGQDLCWDLATCRRKLAAALAAAGQFQEASGEFEAAADLLATLPESTDRIVRWSEVRIGQAELLQQQGHYDLAEKISRQSVAALPPDPKASDDRLLAESARLRSLLGKVLILKGCNPEADDVLRRAIADYTTLVERHPREVPYLEELAVAELTRAGALGPLGSADEELAYRAAIRDLELLQGLVGDLPHVREDLAIAHVNLGRALNGLMRNTEAVQKIDAALGVLQHLAQSPDAPVRQYELLAQACLVQATVLSDLDRRDGAQRHLHNALTILLEGLPREESATAGHQRDTALASIGLGLLYHRHGEWNEARREFELAIQILGDLAGPLGEDPYARDALATACEAMADLLIDLREPARAGSHYEQARTHRERLPQLPAFEFSRVLLLLKSAEPAMRQQALEIARMLAEHCPDHGRYAAVVGAALLDTGNIAEAVAALERIDPQRFKGAGPERDFWLARAYARRNQDGDGERAKTAFQQGEQRMQAEAPGNLRLRRLRAATAADLGLETEPAMPAKKAAVALPDNAEGPSP